PETYEIMTPESVGAEKTDLVLGKHSGRHAFADHLAKLGFQSFTEEKINDLFAKFKELADRKKQVYDDDIIALVVDNLHHKKAFELVAQYYKLGEKGYAYADVRLMTPEGEKADAAVGDGPVDASLKAVERVVGLPISLKDYQIRAITAGKDALGEATLKVEYNGRLYHGRGISTDIVKSSVNAYINAVNSVFLAMELEQQEEE
ncbi:MAG: 2-isopropylmalate synthase, partial [Veillonella sp. DORA_A_3_16_22]